MDKALYFSKPCEACDVAEERGYPGVIGMKYILERRDVRSKQLSTVRLWRKSAEGYVPSVRIDRKGQPTWYKGLTEVESLAEECLEWLNSGNQKRLRFTSRELPVDLGIKVRKGVKSKMNTDVLIKRKSKDNLIVGDIKI